MKMRKLLSSILATTMALQLVSCGSSTPDAGSTGTTDTGSTGTGTSSGVTLSIAIWDTNQEPGLREILAGFTEATGIQTEMVVTPWNQYWTMLEAGATANSLPDVFWMHSNEFTKYAEAGMLLDFTEQINNSEVLEMDKFPEDITILYNHDGSQYAVPKDIDTVALAYNKTMFDEAGLAYPDDTWTWDDFAAAAETLTVPEKGQYGYAMHLENDQESYFNTIYSMGGEVINDDKTQSGYDQDATVKAVKLMSDLTLNGFTPAYEVLAENYPENLFCSGTVAMATLGSWRLPVLGTNDYAIENTGFALLPKDATTGERICVYNGLGWAAAANTDHPAEAFALAEYMGSEAAQKQQSDLGVMISAYEGTAENFIGAYSMFDISPFIEMLDNIVIYPRSNATVVWQELTRQTFVEVWSGRKDVETACAELAVGVNALLAEEQA